MLRRLFAAKPSAARRAVKARLRMEALESREVPAFLLGIKGHGPSPWAVAMPAKSLGSALGPALKPLTEPKSTPPAKPAVPYGPEPPVYGPAPRPHWGGFLVAI